MMFERTSSGIQNRSTFYGVDLVCYIEGVIESETTFSADATFWSKIFAAFEPNAKVKFVARGGKPQLESLAKTLIRKDIKNSLILMDSDFDDFHGDKLDDYRVLYTHGYSWENDVFGVEMSRSIFCALAHSPNVDALIDADLSHQFSKFETASRKAMQADYFSILSKSSLIPRDKPGRFIKTDPDHFGRPFFCKKSALAELRKVNSSTKTKRKLEVTSVPIDAIRFLYGKTVGSYVRALMVYLLKKFVGKRKNISAEHFRDIALQIFENFLKNSHQHPISQHYKNLLARSIA
jgi:hypothetical protein